MINKVSIKHFKSIKKVEFDCTRVNVLIGDTNTGKSNILEALSLFSQGAMDETLGNGLVRYGKVNDLFHAKDQSESIRVSAGAFHLKLALESGNNFKLTYSHGAPNAAVRPMGNYSMAAEGLNPHFDGQLFGTTIRRYEYQSEVRFGSNTMKHLQPPYGRNLPGLLASNKELRDKIGAILRERGVRIIVDNEENTISLPHAREEGVEVRLPYRMVSETLRRYIFMFVAMETAEAGITLLFDEPEQNTFPFYTKHIAEMMALDKKNQFIITTHNEYLLRSLIEKTPKQDLSVFMTHTDDDRNTHVKRMSEDQVSEMLDMDVFFNIDRFLEA